MNITPPGTEQLLYLLFVGLGVFLQIRFSIGKFLKLQDYIFIIILLVIAFLPSRLNPDNSFGVGIIIFLFLTCFYLAFEFKEKLLPKLGETALLQTFIILAYSLSIVEDNQLLNILIVLTVLIIPLLVYSFFTKNVLNSRLKVISFIWFLLVNSLIVIYTSGVNFNYLIQAQTQVDQPINLSILIYSFFLGLTIFYLTINFSFLFRLVPLPRRHTPYKIVKQEIRELIQAILSKFDNDQIKFKVLILTIIIQGGFLVINSYFQIVDSTTAIILSIYLVEVLIYSRITLWRVFLTGISLITKRAN